VIAGPPPGALAKLYTAWREYIAWWMIEHLSPPRREREEPPFERNTHPAKAHANGEAVTPRTNGHALKQPMRSPSRIANIS
jgi:hypothetical protein